MLKSVKKFLTFPTLVIIIPSTLLHTKQRLACTLCLCQILRFKRKYCSSRMLVFLVKTFTTPALDVRGTIAHSFTRYLTILYSSNIMEGDVPSFLHCSVSSCSSENRLSVPHQFVTERPKDPRRLRLLHNLR